MRLSLLDRSRTRTGHAEGAALGHTVERAVRAEELGYERVWVAEHHGVPGVASGAPAVLLAAVGAATSRIRIGSGGVMLPHHQPFVVAEQFRMLAALHPGRVDLGVGRSVGFTAPVRRALRRGAEQPDTFAEDVAELRDHLEDAGPVTARPAGVGPVPVSVLATGRGVEVAAALGLPAVVGGPVLAEPDVGERLAAYRRGFQPHRGSEPHLTVSLDVLVADTDAEARELALPEVWAMVRSRRTGVFGPLEPVVDIRAQRWDAQDAARLERGLDAVVAGSAGTVRRRLEELVERTGADELLVSGSTHDRDALAASDAAVRALVA
ncbi:MsnO8 family LLM class oxidoreductase [Nocardioides marmotae]|uniref:MsnO8 family LLM class oxidoreductase n=1 Tax=Nocardioides marmotae TaxID=2663857 RepID=A0A6I3JE14_9ACTN|nr:MsnO8 family LLM class oxidoreductase [Nocardioides marmotae]MCR6032806.1 MsnO8 family LLM class oxidoreductase [Gordonia jinghuaiqii]MBC9735162.1 MsnO8 family LLM class oxidoreductase [Nocardioides marmotae]MTB86262.1 MsnO8 family LLM class oxidoreductase [Nocardioides marmotae]MTB96456.1 MsnO8 family LLM class oxidoreductase [Nocardioides marmotae]QKE02019.1 MsnO8 family LLM class oxidoreductase [Nocardioides marmotae]